MPEIFVSERLAAEIEKEASPFRISSDGVLEYYNTLSSLHTLLLWIENHEDPVQIIKYYSKLGFNFDFEDVLEEGSVLINVTYKGQGVGEFEVTGNIWGVLKYAYDWYINNRTEAEEEGIYRM